MPDTETGQRMNAATTCRCYQNIDDSGNYTKQDRERKEPLVKTRCHVYASFYSIGQED